MVAISGRLLHWTPYVLLGTLVVLLYFGLKIGERYYDGWARRSLSVNAGQPLPPPEFTAIVESGLKGRALDVSFWFAVLGFVAISTMAGAIPGICEKARVTAVKLSGSHLVILLFLILIEWGLYLQAVFRDHGTFFYHLLPNPSPSHLVYVIQVIEGIVNLSLLALLMVWAAIGHCLVTLLGPLDLNDRKTVRAQAACDLVTACAIPVLIFTGLSTFGIIIDWRTGIVSSFLAKATAVGMWMVFVVLSGRAIVNCWSVLNLKLAWPPCEPK